MAKKQQDSNKLQEQVEQMQARVAELDNQLKRAVADYQNLEKRINEGRSELTSFVGAELVKRLLPVLDHLEQSLGGISDREKLSGWVKGVELAVKEFKAVLQSQGLDEVVTDGQFDPNLHEAVDTREPTSAEALESKDDNSILQVVRKGYNLNGKVLRPAQVIVGRSNVTLGSEATPESEDSGQARMTERGQNG